MEDEKKIKNKGSESESELELKLKRFESIINWICIDQSNPWKASFSFFLFLIFGISVPIASHVGLDCRNCDEDHKRPYHAIEQLSLSVFATLSFTSLSSWLRVYGFRRLLLLDKLISHHNLHFHYSKQLQRSMELISYLVVPCLMGEAAYKMWWYISAANQIPYYGNMYISYITACTLELCSWLYTTSIFFFICILYRLICHLQIIRLENFALVFHQEAEVGSILMEHLGLRRTLRIISHRFRVFMLLSLVLVTATQFISLLLTTRSNAHVNVSKAGQLALCSMSLVTGILICLGSAAKITHKAHSITCLAAKWHVSAIINTNTNTFHGLIDAETPAEAQLLTIRSDSDNEDQDDNDELDDAKLPPVFAHTISFQKREALVIYLKNNKAGITVYGFTVDRTWLKSIFAIELALVLWLLNKTIGIS